MGCRRLSRREALCALSGLTAGGLLARPQERPTFTSDVKVVNVLATVRDKKGEIVRNLTREDFQLDEDGRTQVIKYFSQESNLPLTLGLLVDTSGSTRGVLPEMRDASQRFLKQVLRPEQDFAFVIKFDFEVELLEDLTSSREKLEKALENLETGYGPPRLNRRDAGGYPGGGYPGPRGGGGPGGRRGGGTTLYDSVLLAADELMKPKAGRKALILMSDGQDNGSKVSLSTAIEAAQRADTLVYSILFDALDDFGVPRWMRGGTPDGKKVLDQISRETGARFFQVTKRWPLEKVYAAIEEDLRNQYNLGYTPERPDSKEYRKIRLTTKQKGLLVQTREGYYPT